MSKLDELRESFDPDVMERRRADELAKGEAAERSEAAGSGFLGALAGPPVLHLVIDAHMLLRVTRLKLDVMAAEGGTAEAGFIDLDQDAMDALRSFQTVEGKDLVITEARGERMVQMHILSGAMLLTMSTTYGGKGPVTATSWTYKSYTPARM